MDKKIKKILQLIFRLTMDNFDMIMLLKKESNMPLSEDVMDVLKDIRSYQYEFENELKSM